MQAEIFPSIKKCKYPTNIISYEEKCIFHEKILSKYLKRLVNGWSINTFFLNEKIEKYILYSITDFTEIVCDDLKHIELFVPGKICDRRASEYPEGYRGWEVVDIKKMIDLYQAGKVDKIIILSVLHENEIIDDLLCRGIDLNDLISLVNILWS